MIPDKKKNSRTKYPAMAIFLMLFAALVALTVIASEQPKIMIERIHPDQAFLTNTPLEIKLRITNDLDEHVNAAVTEILNTNLAYYNYTNNIKELNYEGLKVRYYEWLVDLPPKSVKEITYKVLPKSLGIINFNQAVLTAEGVKAESSPSLLIIKCRPDGVCSKGENAIFCPEDCDGSIADDYCDGTLNGICDPDCEKGYDLDCEKNISLKGNLNKKQGQVGIVFYVGLIIILLAIFLVYFMYKHRHPTR